MIFGALSVASNHRASHRSLTARVWSMRRLCHSISPLDHSKNSRAATTNNTLVSLRSLGPLMYVVKNLLTWTLTFTRSPKMSERISCSWSSNFCPAMMGKAWNNFSRIIILKAEIHPRQEGALLCKLRSSGLDQRWEVQGIQSMVVAYSVLPET